ncbi:2-oxo acid dehydrogenase subunit E2 [Paraburkholderia rhynchosiae]|uniref:Dihydrolipoyllysine-residue acetyltransferase component of pyruvate dehydrogenase complex n=1 Tax=Paraburkholderia rhynchosiae TaxID=487049 RepID=A0A2N7W523_9BURK|nr:2-oxo acid dehydrogenase subunit E2 [Paraburkholderia rhynchosiae]PMS24501.1 dihydrolipoamide acetyltransferase [Paraburkholderia rhynchosiae]CAB3735975.1 Dihydrolipoyllysine-residue acetyltransferase component of pyruvate dehydrogenase complex [Paraburkholderia rhynchosiae]
MKSSSGFHVDLPPWPEVDFAAFGETETLPLSRIQKLTAGYLSRNWLAIPQVTHHDEADITSLDACRAQLAEQCGSRVTPLAFIVKALAQGLREFPRFNASLDADGQNLIVKKYFHIGIAVDTPSGLLVAVIRDCDKKSVVELAGEIHSISARAREKGLPMSDMVGGCMTISSLGNIGGTAFSPIINAPEVAILGVTKAQWKPCRNDNAIDWRLMLPLALTYDHRVINGADAARFAVFVADVLGRPQSLIE